MSATHSSSASAGDVPSSNVRSRWIQLGLGIVAMMAISSPQYVWALFVLPMQAKFAASLTAIQTTIAVFSICQCGLGPMHGFLAGWFKARTFAAIGGLLVGASWLLSSQVTSLYGLYLTYGVLSGIGTGMIYVTVVELMTQWFPDRRGLAIGLVSGSYGFGAIATTFPIAASIGAVGLDRTLLLFGLTLGAICVLAAIGMRRPPEGHFAELKAELETRIASVRSFRTGEMVRQPLFWLLFTMMSMMATGGLMAISQIGAFAKDFGLTPEVTVLGMAALPLALTVDRLMNGMTRPLFGWISDHIGRENTMFVAFALEGFAIYMLLVYGGDPLMFVILTGIVFLGWGEIYSLFPALLGDLFGPRHAASNFGILLMATAVGAVFGGPLAAMLYESTRSWNYVFGIVIALDMVTAALALAVLKPMGQRWKERSAMGG